MEDLYGKTVNKSLAGLSLHSVSGRVSPVEIGNKRPGPQSVFSGRLTPIDTSLGKAGRPGHGSLHQNGLLNLSSHNSSKLSSSNSGSNVTKTTVDLSQHELNSTQISPISAGRRPLVDSQHNGGQNISRNKRDNPSKKSCSGNVSNLMLVTADAGVKEMIQSLGLLCLVSLLLALGSLVFLLKILPSPLPDSTSLENLLTDLESRTVHQVTVAMIALTLSLNLSCLLVCAIQFLFSAKLVKSSQGRIRTTKYLKKASITRTCAIAGFFLSIPLFLIGIVLFTFLHFNETPAIVTSVVIGVGIVFCGAAVIHNVFVWQREKTALRKSNSSVVAGSLKEIKNRSLTQSRILLPHATLDLSNGFNGTIMAKSLELSTLV